MKGLLKGFLVGLMVMLAGVTYAQTVTLPLPPGTLLSGGISCGGVPTSYYMKGFNVKGNPYAVTYSRISCSTGGRGSRPHLYYFWNTVTWDFFGGWVISPYNGESLVTSVTSDSYGNVDELSGYYNVPTLIINQLPPNAAHIAYTIPDISRLTVASGLAALKADQMVPSVVYTYTTQFLPGTVMYTTPNAGTMQPVGTTVQVVASLGVCDGVTVNCD